MENDPEQLASRPAGIQLLAQVSRVTGSFICLTLTYLLSGIPYAATSDWDIPLDARAPSTGRAVAIQDALPNTVGSRIAELGIGEWGTAERRIGASYSDRPSFAVSRIAADSFWSPALGTRKQFVVYLPPSYQANSTRRYPVAYYLHGMSGDEWNWVRAGAIDRTLDSLIAGGLPEMIVVMPDGDDSWYTTWNNLGNNAECRRTQPPGRQSESVDAFCVPWPHYDDYIARDLVARVDSVYRTIPSRDARAIAGLSMGGYGALTLALAYPDVFSAAASHSGVLSPLYAGPHPYASPPRYATNETELRENAKGLWPALVLAFGRDTVGWWARDPGRRAAQYTAPQRLPMPALMFDVGVNDPYVDQSRDLHATLERLGIAHTYAEWPGAHSWDYWRRHAGESLRWIGGRMATGMAGR